MQSTQNRLIDLLVRHKDDYISGQMLSEKLNISRSAIWKHMKSLEKTGYHIEAKPRVGYRIISYPTHLSEYTLKWGLKTEWLGKTIFHKKSTKSTQIDAHQLAQDQAAHGTVIIADEQTGGKGRDNRKWYSTKSKGVWLSMILRPKIYPYEAPQMTLLTATVLAEVISSLTNFRPQIKWPNDILMENKKVAGILTEMQAEQDQIQYVVIGIGINVNHQLIDFPDSIREKATSLKMETKNDYSIVHLVQQILLIFEKQYHQYIENGFPNIKNKWENYGYKLGELIWINTPKESWQATFLGIAEDGALLTKSEDGDIKKIYSAEIDWLNGEDGYYVK